MKTKTIIISAMLAMVVAGCGKEVGDGHIHLFAERMTAGGDSKLLFDPTQIDDALWVAGESININGESLTITGNANDGYAVDATMLGTANNYYAIYPATVNADGNNITVTNNQGSGGTVTIESLLLDFKADGTHEVYFPMVSPATSASASSMELKHLTGGMKLTLQNNGTSDINLSTLKVITQTPTASSHIAATEGVTASWAVQGPTVPSGTVGGVADRDMKYSCEMLFILKSTAGDYVTIAGNGGTVSFCVPVTIGSVKSITVVGYGYDDVESFSKTASLGEVVSIERNKMYTIKTIVIN